MARNLVLAATLLLVISQVGVALAAPPAPDGASVGAAAHVPGEVLVRWEGDVVLGARGQALDALEPSVIGTTALGPVEVVSLEEGADPVAAARQLSRQPGVAYAEPNWIVEAAAVDSDEYDLLWGFEQDSDIDIDASDAWLTTTGSEDVVVAVIDTGVDIGHSDLAPNIWVNPGETLDGEDEDDNGLIDDVNGWDFANEVADVYDADDGDEHGTHVAGTIAAAANGTGVVGVAPSVRIMPLKFLVPSESGGATGSVSDAIEAIEYAAAKGAHIINASWGSSSYSQALEDAIAASGLLFVAAAGNGGSDQVGDDTDTDSSPHYPSGLPLDNIISVAAVASDGTRASFSNYGATSVDLGAPGANIVSTYPGDLLASASGTSMAAPHVAGVAALVLSRKPDLAVAGVVDAILDWTQPLASLDGDTVTGGMLNAAASVSTTVPPGVPTDVTATPASGAADLSWTAPAQGLAAPVTDYEVRVLDADGTGTPQDVTGELVRTLGSAATSFRFDGLSSSSTYTFTVAAVNVAGTGDPSAVTAGVTPEPTVPSAPTGVTVEPGDGQLAVSWDPSAELGGSAITEYTATATPEGGTSTSATTADGDTTSITIGSLDNGVAYTVTVFATNDQGDGPGSVPVVATPRTVPGAPTDVTPLGGNGEAVVSWVAPADNGGAAVTSYRVAVLAEDGTSPATGVNGEVTRDTGSDDTSYTFGGLSNGVSYTFRVSSTNPAGTGAASAASGAVTPGPVAPGAPDTVTATAGQESATVTWTAPTDTGGSPITGYRVIARADGSEVATVDLAASTTSHTFTGLTAGVPHTFTVAAINANGVGPAATSAVVTPTAPPPSGGGGGGGGGGGAAPPPAPPPTQEPGSVATVAEPGETVTTDPDGTGATPEVPVQTAVTSPTGGEVSVVPSDEVGEVDGYRLLGRRLTITAPPATTDQPLELTFRVHTSLTEGVPDVVPVRDGTPVPACTGPDGVAEPDPCVAAAEIDGDEVVLRVLTSRASVWEFGVLDDQVVALSCDGVTRAFADVAPGNVHADAIACVAAHGIANGRTATAYAPRGSVTRAQLSSFVVRLLDAVDRPLPAPDGSVTFSDIGTSAHADAILRLAEAGIVSGVGGGRFAPDAPVRRGQMATFLVRAYAHATASELPAGPRTFDDTAGTPHADAIDAVAAAGITAGLAPGRYGPEATVRRDQMASFLVSLLGVLAGPGG